MKNFYLNGLQIHSNTVDLGFVVNQSYTGLESPNIRLATYDKPGEHGSVVSNQLYGGRNIFLPGRISGATPAQYQINRRTLQNALRIIKDINAVSAPVILQFQTMDDLFLQANVYLKDIIQMPIMSIEHGDFILSLFAPDPNLYAQTITSYSIMLSMVTGLVYPVIYPVTYPAAIGGQVTAFNAGDVNTPFTLTFNGPMSSPFITNLTSGESFLIHLSLALGDQLVIDMQKKTMVLNGSSNALQYFDLANVWMQLLPGNNLIKLGSASSSDTGNAIISFRSAYFGI